MTIGQLAGAAKVNVQTVRFYERTGLLSPAARSASGYRVYGPHELRRLHFIKRAQALGFTLREIGELLALRVQGPASCRTVQTKAARKLLAVEEKIKDLRALAKTLRILVQTCEEGKSTGHCPILESLSSEDETLA